MQNHPDLIYVSKILLVEKFQMSPHDRCGECVQFMGLYCNLCRFVAKSVIYAVLSGNFMWRKIEPKSTFVEKNDKYQVCSY